MQNAEFVNVTTGSTCSYHGVSRGLCSAVIIVGPVSRYTCCETLGQPSVSLILLSLADCVVGVCHQCQFMPGGGKRAKTWISSSGANVFIDVPCPWNDPVK